jgi:uncharacterized protein (TIGR00270 family)
MRCEICGREFPYKPRRAIVEGAKLLVCDECAKHSSSSWREERKLPPPGTSYKPKYTSKPSSRTFRRPTEKDEDYLLVKGYGAIIRKAREKRGWSQEELGLKLNEKASFIGKLESAKVVPNPNLIDKLKHMLNIELLGKEIPTAPPKPATGTVPHELTLGDVISFGKLGKKGKSEKAS